MANGYFPSRRADSLSFALCLTAALFCATGACADTAPDSAEVPATGLPSPAELEQRGAIIGSIAIHVDDIFDRDDPRENNWLYRTANKLKINTRDGTVREQLLFKPGDRFSAQKAEETARLLRGRSYFSEADVVPVAYHTDANTVDLSVRVRDVWTIEPGIGFGRTGGANKTRARLADENFLGRGQSLALEYKSNVDRSGVGIEFTDPNLFHSRWGTQAKYADTSDGSIYGLSIDRPFYSLDSRWSAGVIGISNDQTTSLYDLGEVINKFDSKYDTLNIHGGYSKGLVGGWTRRWLAGYRYDRARFKPTVGDLLSVLVPEDRLLSYPWIGIELIQNRYGTTENQDQIGRTEDVFLGRRFQASIGWAAPALGSDRSAGIFSFVVDMGRPLRENNILLLDASWNGRLESGSTADSVLEGNARFYHRFNEKNLFVTKLDVAHAHALDRDQQLQLGGDNGLRGYPLRYQTGDTRVLATIEERYFTDWFPWRLFRVGGAVFADVGRTWGQAPLASESQGWLGDVGFGVRIGNARSGIGNVLHIDLAFPLGGTNDISSVQLLIEAEKSF